MLAVLAVAGGGFALCASIGWPFHPGPVTVAALATLVGSGAAFVPVVLARGSSQAAMAQASLVGTVIHLFGCLVGAATLLLVLRTGTAGAYWMLAFYWATLAVVVVELSRAVRRATPTPGVPQQ
jgi:Mg2+/citrate symporter